jgi:four helix bundle protein
VAGFKRVEDIEAWQEARKLATQVYKLTSVGAWSKDFGLRDQTRRSAVSIACNIAEGFAREGSVEFNRFLIIARGSAVELKTQMYIALDLGYIDKAAFDAVYESTDKVCRMIAGLVQYLRSVIGRRQQTTKNQQSSGDN